MMDFIQQVERQLKKMSEKNKDAWILSQAKLLPENGRTGFLMSLSGQKSAGSMPTMEEIDKFCDDVESGEIYFEYETHYYEFDDDGHYMDDWKTWHNDPCNIAGFLNRIFCGCHDSFLLDEYQVIADVMNRICNLTYMVHMAEESEDQPDEEFFTLSGADKEGMFLIGLSDAGEYWIRATARLLKQQDEKEAAYKLIQLFEHPIGSKVKPRILTEEDISPEIFENMEEMLQQDIVKLKQEIKPKTWNYEEFKKQEKLKRKEEMLSDIQIKCLKSNFAQKSDRENGLASDWARVNEIIKWLSYEFIDDQPEIDEVQKICEEMIHSGKLGEEDWKIRKTVLNDIIDNDYYDHYCCGDVMQELQENLCTCPEEYLALADIMNDYGPYREKAAYLYHQYGRDDKYISYLEQNLGRRSKEYSALIRYYQENGQQEKACLVAQQGLEMCKEDLTDCFACLLVQAKREKDQDYFKKLYASAKRRKHVNIAEIERALAEGG